MLTLFLSISTTHNLPRSHIFFRHPTRFMMRSAVFFFLFSLFLTSTLATPHSVDAQVDAGSPVSLSLNPVDRALGQSWCNRQWARYHKGRRILTVYCKPGFCRAAGRVHTACHDDFCVYKIFRGDTGTVYNIRDGGWRNWCGRSNNYYCVFRADQKRFYCDRR